MDILQYVRLLKNRGIAVIFEKENINTMTELGKINKKGEVKWIDSGIRGIIKYEKYKGDLLLQKTITTNPMTKRRIENFGEEEQYYVRDHHEPIVTAEVWEQAREIRMSRNRQTDKKADGKREKHTMKSMMTFL